MSRESKKGTPSTIQRELWFIGCIGTLPRPNDTVPARDGPNMLAFKVLAQRVRVPVNSMPPYTTKVVSDQQLADIYAFLRTVPKPPDVSTIPLLQ